MIEEYTSAVYSAIYKEIPIDCDKIYVRELQVYSFPQIWSSTALGFSEIGGQAFTDALTVVVVYNRTAYIYFGGSFAYKVNIKNQKVFEDISKRNMKKVSESSYYDK